MALLSVSNMISKCAFGSFPGGSGKNNPHTCQCRRSRFNLWSEKILHSTEQWSPCATTVSLCSKAQELQLLNPRAQTTGAHVPWSPWSATRATPCHRSLRPEDRCHSARGTARGKAGQQRGLAQPKASKSIHLVLKVGLLQSRLLSWRCVYCRAWMCVSVPESKSYSLFLVLHVNVKKL